MAGWGNVDYRQLEKMQEQLKKFQQAASEEFCMECVKEIAARLLRKTVKRTPVGKVNGGTLRRGWTIGNVVRQGNQYNIEVINATEYAAYVEFGHRTRNHTGWVPGRFMLTISEKEINNLAPKLIEKKLQKKLEEVFSGQ